MRDGDRSPHEQPQAAEERTPPAIVAERLGKRYRLGRPSGPVPVPSVLPWSKREPRSLEARGEGQSDDELEDEESAADEERWLQPAEENLGPNGEIWALRDVSFEIEDGATVGIIGANGAGKSTLLRILARITPPTEGRVAIRGRVAPLFALATAYMEAESTGRENVFLLAELFGIPRHVAARCVDTVLEFAGIGALADTPLKKYSEGLARRLAYSTVLNLDADVLLVDEMLSAGDRGFRGQCVRRIEEATDGGLSLVFASHDMEAIHRFCREAVWLEGGRVIERGEAGAVIERYEGQTGRHSAHDRASGGLESAPPDGVGAERASEYAEVVSAGAFTMDGERAPALSTREDGVLEIELMVLRGGVELRCVVLLAAKDGRRVRFAQPTSFQAERGRCTVSVHVPAGLLSDGEYRARVGAKVNAGGERSSILQVDAFTLDVYQPEDFEEAVPEDRARVDADLGSDLTWGVSASPAGDG
jgi:ABC-type polysaccharide/polyol phosphate transport system ATPase subunit